MPDDDGLSEKAAKTLSQFPGPVTLHPSKLKWSVLFFGTTLIALMGAWDFWDGSVHMEDYEHMIRGPFLLIVGGLGAALMGIGLVTKSMFLTLNATGFECGFVWSRMRRSWRDADRFTAVTMMVKGITQYFVAFDDATRTAGFWNAVALAIDGRNRRLPDTYGLKAADLARLMTAWRERALAQM